MIEITLYRLKHKGGTKFYNALRVNGPGVDAAVFNWGAIEQLGQFQKIDSLGSVTIDTKLRAKKGRGYLSDDPALVLRGPHIGEVAAQIDRLSGPDVRRCWNALPPHIMQKLNNGSDFAASVASEYAPHGEPLRKLPPKPEKPSATKANPNYGMFA